MDHGYCSVTCPSLSFLMAALGYIGKYEEISCDCDLAEIGKK